MRRYWVGWEYKNPTYELVPTLMAEINEMLEKNKIEIIWNWSDKSSWDYKINLKLKGNNKK